MEVRVVTQEELGNYTCTAKNSGGGDEFTMELKLAGQCARSVFPRNVSPINFHEMFPQKTSPKLVNKPKILIGISSYSQYSRSDLCLSNDILMEVYWKFE